MKYYRENYTMGISIWKYTKEGKWYNMPVMYRESANEEYKRMTIPNKWRLWGYKNPWSCKRDRKRYKKITEKEAFIEML